MATMNLNIKPFPIPNLVTLDMPPGKRQDGMQALPTLPLSALPEETLNALIEEFAAGVLAAAGKA